MVDRGTLLGGLSKSTAGEGLQPRLRLPGTKSTTTFPFSPAASAAASLGARLWLLAGYQ